MTPKNQPDGPESRSSFDVRDPALARQIDVLLDKISPASIDGSDNRDLVREMIMTCLKTYDSRLDRGDVKILNRALRELRFGFRLFKDYRDRRKVTIFGSARISPDTPAYKSAAQFAKDMVKNNFMVITGAGPGIMKAGNQGAGKGNSFGINIRLPYEQEANEFISKDPRFIDCRFFFTRKLMFVKEASAAAFFPGGFGTHDEGMEVLTLVQTGKCDLIPLVFVDAPGGGYWKEWKAYLEKHLLKTAMISPEDTGLFKITNSVDEAVAEIMGFYKNYHSMRYVKRELVIRLQKDVSESALAAISKSFADICVKGTFRRTGALEEESEREHLHLPRIAFHFDRIHYGRLRQLVNYLNGL